MSKTIHADLKNDTNHRNVFTLTDTLIDKVLFANRNMDSDEVLPSVELARMTTIKGRSSGKSKARLAVKMMMSWMGTRFE